MLPSMRVPVVDRVGTESDSPTARVLLRRNGSASPATRSEEADALIASLVVALGNLDGHAVRPTLVRDRELFGRDLEVKAAAVVLETLDSVVGELRRQARVKEEAVDAEAVASEAVSERPAKLNSYELPQKRKAHKPKLTGGSRRDP